MVEEKIIKQFEEEQLNKLLTELKDINNFKECDGVFKYSLGKYQADLLLAHIGDLQQRIDKTIELCNIVIENEPLQAIPNEELLDQVCGIKLNQFYKMRK